jgi:hypothetical protein
MPVAELLADDLLDVDALTEDELLKDDTDNNEAQAILCSCCCSWCGC